MAEAVVTGASGGIGLQVALGLARLGWGVTLVGRDAGRTERARATIAAAVRGTRLDTALADLADPAAVRGLAEALRGRGRIDLLVNNAGVFGRDFRRTMAINHYAPFVLTDGLLPAMGKGGRIVNVGSVIAFRARTADLEAPAGRDPFGVQAYARSKLALLMASFGWAGRLAGAGVTVNVVHPGMVATNIARGGLPGLTWRLIGRFLLTAEQGAAAPLHLALDPALAETTGAWFDRLRRAEPPAPARDPAAVERLWRQTARLTGAG